MGGLVILILKKTFSLYPPEIGAKVEWLNLIKEEGVSKGLSYRINFLDIKKSY
jgi:hypothetical protein